MVGTQRDAERFTPETHRNHRSESIYRKPCSPAKFRPGLPCRPRAPPTPAATRRAGPRRGLLSGRGPVMGPPPPDARPPRETSTPSSVWRSTISPTSCSRWRCGRRCSAFLSISRSRAWSRARPRVWSSATSCSRGWPSASRGARDGPTSPPCRRGSTPRARSGWCPSCSGPAYPAALATGLAAGDAAGTAGGLRHPLPRHDGWIPAVDHPGLDAGAALWPTAWMSALRLECPPPTACWPSCSPRGAHRSTAVGGRLTPTRRHRPSAHRGRSGWRTGSARGTAARG